MLMRLIDSAAYLLVWWAEMFYEIDLISAMTATNGTVSFASIFYLFTLTIVRKINFHFRVSNDVLLEPSLLKMLYWH